MDRWYPTRGGYESMSSFSRAGFSEVRFFPPLQKSGCLDLWLPAKNARVSLVFTTFISHVYFFFHIIVFFVLCVTCNSRVKRFGFLSLIVELCTTTCSHSHTPSNVQIFTCLLFSAKFRRDETFGNESPFACFLPWHTILGQGDPDEK